MISFRSTSLAETERFGELLAGNLRGGEVIGLSGPLGAGKTELVRGLMKALDARVAVSSPTFVLENVYQVSGETGSDITSVHHWDLYRITGDFSEYDIAEFRGDSSKVVLVEWPEKVAWVEDLLDLKLRLDYVSIEADGAEANERLIEIEPSTSQEALFERLENALN